MNAVSQCVRRLPERVIQGSWWDRFRLRSRMTLHSQPLPHLLRHYLVLKTELMEQLQANRHREPFLVVSVAKLGISVCLYCRLTNVKVDQTRAPLWRQLDTKGYQFGYQYSPTGKLLRYTDMVINQPYAFPHLHITYCEPVEFLSRLITMGV